MNTTLKKFKLESGDPVYVEAHQIVVSGRPVDAAANLEDTAGTFERAWKQLRPAMKRITEELKEASPDQIEVKFGIKLSADLNAVFAASSAEGNFEITMTWKKPTA